MKVCEMRIHAQGGLKLRLPPTRLRLSLFELLAGTHPFAPLEFPDAAQAILRFGATDGVRLPRSSKSRIQNNPLVEQVLAASSQGLCVGA